MWVAIKLWAGDSWNDWTNQMIIAMRTSSSTPKRPRAQKLARLIFCLVPVISEGGLRMCLSCFHREPISLQPGSPPASHHGMPASQLLYGMEAGLLTLRPIKLLIRNSTGLKGVTPLNRNRMDQCKIKNYSSLYVAKHSKSRYTRYCMCEWGTAKPIE